MVRSSTMTMYWNLCQPPASSKDFTEFCNQLALGVFQILKTLILTMSYSHNLKSNNLKAFVFQFFSTFYVFVYGQISFMYRILKCILRIMSGIYCVNSMKYYCFFLT